MAFHTAALVSSYMIIYGGYTHKHNRREVCYSPELYFYHLDCHVWVSSSAMEHRYQYNPLNTVAVFGYRYCSDRQQCSKSR